MEDRQTSKEIKQTDPKKHKGTNRIEKYVGIHMLRASPQEVWETRIHIERAR